MIYHLSFNIISKYKKEFKIQMSEVDTSYNNPISTY